MTYFRWTIIFEDSYSQKKVLTHNFFYSTYRVPASSAVINNYLQAAYGALKSFIR